LNVVVELFGVSVFNLRAVELDEVDVQPIVALALYMQLEGRLARRADRKVYQSELGLGFEAFIEPVMDWC